MRYPWFWTDCHGSAVAVEVKAADASRTSKAMAARCGRIKGSPGRHAEPVQTMSHSGCAKLWRFRGSWVAGHCPLFGPDQNAIAAGGLVVDEERGTELFQLLDGDVEAPGGDVFADGDCAGLQAEQPEGQRHPEEA